MAEVRQGVDALGRALDVDGSYTAIPVEPENLERGLKTLAEQGYAGVNVTVPHKEGALALCARLDGAASSSGSAQ